MNFTHWVLLVTVAGCKAPAAPSDPGGEPSDGEPADDTATPASTTDSLPAATGTTGDTAVPWDTSVDCAGLLPAPVAFTKYDWIPGSEDFTFSADGYLVQASGGALKRTPFGGPSEILVPLDADARGTRFLPDGRVVLATSQNGTLLAVDPVTGSQQAVASGLTNPNGLAIGLDGRIYVATTGQIVRVDPVGGGAIEVVADLPGNSFDGLVFSPDYTRLYFNEEFGQIHYVDFDADGNPGTPRVGAQIPLGGIAFSILDGMSMDACGNLYVIEMNGTIWRVRTDGTVEELVTLPGATIIPAMNFGYPPVGGWNPTALYVITFTGAVYELEVGVPGKWEPHLPPVLQP